MSKEPHIAFTLRIPKKLKSKLEKDARDNKRSLNQQIVHWLDLCASGRQEKNSATA